MPVRIFYILARDLDVNVHVELVPTEETILVAKELMRLGLHNMPKYESMFAWEVAQIEQNKRSPEFVLRIITADIDGEYVGWAYRSGIDCYGTSGYYVAKQHRRQGIGTALHKMMCRKLPPAEVAFPEARGFFSSLGFTSSRSNFPILEELLSHGR